MQLQQTGANPINIPNYFYQLRGMGNAGNNGTGKRLRHNSWGGSITLYANSRINNDDTTNTFTLCSNASAGINFPGSPSYSLNIGGAGSTLVAGNINGYTYAISSGDTLTMDSLQTVTLAAATTYYGTTRIAQGTLLLANSLALQYSTVDLDAADSGASASARLLPPRSARCRVRAISSCRMPRSAP